MARKYAVLVITKHSESFFAQTPEEEAASQHEVNQFIVSWRPKIIHKVGYHAVGFGGEYDYFTIFEMDELSDWEAFREEYYRRFQGRVAKHQVYIGVGHEEFVRATAHIGHWQELRRLGMMPGVSQMDQD